MDGCCLIVVVVVVVVVILKGNLGFPSQVGPLRLGEDSALVAHAERRWPGLELSPVTEKIIKNRRRRR